MIICVFISAATCLVSAVIGFGSWADIGESSRSILLGLTAVSATIAVGSLEAFEAQGPAKKDEK